MTFEEIQKQMAEVYPYWVHTESLKALASSTTHLFLHTMTHCNREAVIYEYRAVDEPDLLGQVHKGRMRFKKQLQEEGYLL